MVLALCGYNISRARRDYELLPEFFLISSHFRPRMTAKIYLVDASAYFARPGPRIVDGLEILAGILHPRNFLNSLHAGLTIRALSASANESTIGNRPP